MENDAAADADGADGLVPWWSFTKTVIAAAALVLVEQGRLALDTAPVRNRPFTLRQLLQHRAGLADYGALPEYHRAVAAGAEPWRINELMARAEADRLRYPPGRGWRYSNIGYFLAGRCIEDASGEHLGAALTRLVLAPLGCESVRLAREPRDLASVTMGAAAGYHPGWVYHGLLVGPLRSACVLLHRLMTGALLPDPLLDEMCRPYELGGELQGRPWRTRGYGLGVMIGTAAGGTPIVGHTGGGPGSTIAVYHRPGSAVPRTAAAFALGDDEAQAENAPVGRLADWRPGRP